MESVIQSVKTLPGADCGTDHELLVGQIKVRLKKTLKPSRPIRYDLSNITEAYSITITNRFEHLQYEEQTPEEMWGDIKAVVT